VTLDPDVQVLVRTLMQERALSFKEAVNLAIREGLGDRRPRVRHRTPAAALGVPSVPLTKALALADALEDDEVVRKMALGK
jgi:hypothetical protein